MDHVQPLSPKGVLERPDVPAKVVSWSGAGNPLEVLDKTGNRWACVETMVLIFAAVQRHGTHDGRENNAAGVFFLADHAGAGIIRQAYEGNRIFAKYPNELVVSDGRWIYKNTRSPSPPRSQP